MKKALKIGIIAIIAIFIAAAIIYRMPYKFEKEFTVCSLDGEVRTVKVDMVWQRYFTKPSKLLGNVYFNDKTYYNADGYIDENGKWDMVGSPQARGFFKIIQDIGEKFSRTKFLPWMKADLKENVEKFHELNFDDSVYIYFKDTKFEQIEMIEVIFPEGENHTTGISYFGPAETAEEAEELMNEIYDDGR